MNLRTEIFQGLNRLRNVSDGEANPVTLKNQNKEKKLFKSPHPSLLPEGEGAGIPKSTALNTASANTENECASAEHAANQAIALGSRIFLTTGSKDLAVFLQAPGADQREWFVRVTPEPEFIQRAIDLGIPRSRICAMQGPFSEAFNTALWRDLKIDCVISKDSGDAGGYQAKVAATQALGIPLLVIKRPKLDYPLVTSTFDALLRQLHTWNITA